MSSYAVSTTLLPWESSTDNELFKKVCGAALVVFFAFAIPICIIKLPELSRAEKSELPPQLARVMIEQQELVPPKPVEPPKPEEKKIQPRPVPAPVQTKPKAVEEVSENKPLSESESKKRALADRKQLTDSDVKARETAKKAGLLALSNELNTLVDNSDSLKASVSQHLTSNTVGKNAAAVQDTSAINSAVAQTGGEINAKQYGKDISKTQIADRDATKLNGDLFDNKKSGGNGKDSGGTRTEEEVALMFEKNKNSLTTFIERERRKTPGLQGKVVLQLTIAPSGDVTQVKIISSELNNPDVEKRLIDRVMLFKFKQVGTTPVAITFPLEFFPS